MLLCEESPGGETFRGKKYYKLLNERVVSLEKGTYQAAELLNLGIESNADLIVIFPSPFPEGSPERGPFG